MASDINYKKGFFRGWIVFSLVWIGLFGFSAFPTSAVRTLGNDRNIESNQKVARVQMPDGQVARFSVPKDATPEQAQQMIDDNAEKLIAEHESSKKSIIDFFLLLFGVPLCFLLAGAAVRYIYAGFKHK